MGGRRNIKVVTGTWGAHVMAPLWEKLAQFHDVELLVLQDGNEARIRTSLPVRLFSQIPEMQGFYRDLDHHLAGADLVVGIETTRLHSFQALRCAKSMGVPFVALAHEFTPMFYDKFANIRAIQFDILQNADLLLCSSHRAARLLFGSGVAKERVQRVAHFIDSLRDGFDPNGATKFRNYIGVREDELLIVARTHFGKQSNASAILKGVRKSLGTLPVHIATRLRLLMIGLGNDIQELKYEAVDLGLGSRLIFMNQDPESFWRDVTSAAHLVVWDRWTDSQNIEPYPFGMMSGLATGVQTAIPAASIFDEASTGVSVHRLEEMNPLDVSEVIENVFKDVSHLLSERLRIAEFVAEQCGVERAADSLQAALMPLTAQNGVVDVRSKVQSFIETVSSPMMLAQAREAIVQVEEALLVANLPRDMIAELWRIKGDAQVALSQGEGALSSFEKATQINSKCYRAHRGLGYLAWQGHSHDDAVGFFKRALSVAPNDYHATLGVGLVYRRLRMLGESAFWLGKAVELGGADSSAMGLLVQACVESSDSPIALETLESLRASFGDLPLILRGLSQVYLAQGRGDEAGPLLDQASST